MTNRVHDSVKRLSKISLYMAQLLKINELKFSPDLEAFLNLDTENFKLFMNANPPQGKFPIAEKLFQKELKPEIPNLERM